MDRIVEQLVQEEAAVERVDRAICAARQVALPLLAPLPSLLVQLSPLGEVERGGPMDYRTRLTVEMCPFWSGSGQSRIDGPWTRSCQTRRESNGALGARLTARGRG